MDEYERKRFEDYCARLEAENAALRAIAGAAQRLYRHEQNVYEKLGVMYGLHDDEYRDCLSALYAAVGDARVATVIEGEIE